MVPEIKNILCPVDLSGESFSALAEAAAVASKFKARLIVCYCSKPVSRAVYAKTRRRLEEVAKDVLERFVAWSGIGDEIGWESLVVEHDDVPLGIIDAAEKCRAELIAMNSSYRPLLHTVIGSAAEAVSRDGPCSVLVFHPSDELRPAAAPRFAKILVAYDFSDYAEIALQHALALADKYAAELHLLHVITDPIRHETELAWTESSLNHLYHQTNERLRQALPRELPPASKICTGVRWGKPYREIIAYVEEHGIDLVAMGAHGKDFGLSTLFGSNVDRVLRQARGAVLVARPLRPILEKEAGQELVSRSSPHNGDRLARDKNGRENSPARTGKFSRPGRPAIRA